jgi:hypothetical protein
MLLQDHPCMSTLRTLVSLKAVALSALPIAAWIGVAFAEPPRSAEGFIRSLYARYPLKDGEVSITFDANLSRWFTRPLLSALERDNQYVERTRLIGGLDWDPLCECQDDDGLRLLSVRTDDNAQNGVIVTVRIWLPATPGYGGQNEGDIRFFLVRTAEGWRIADIGSNGRKSLNGKSLAGKLAATHYTP